MPKGTSITELKQNNSKRASCSACRLNHVRFCAASICLVHRCHVRITDAGTKESCFPRSTVAGQPQIQKAGGEGNLALAREAHQNPEFVEEVHCLCSSVHSGAWQDGVPWTLAPPACSMKALAQRCSARTVAVLKRSRRGFLQEKEPPHGRPGSPRANVGAGDSW